MLLNSKSFIFIKVKVTRTYKPFIYTAFLAI